MSGVHGGVHVGSTIACIRTLQKPFVAVSSEIKRAFSAVTKLYAFRRFQQLSESCCCLSEQQQQGSHSRQ